MNTCYEIYQVSVKRILSKSGGGVIFSGLTNDNVSVKTVVPFNLISVAPKVGEVWEVTGEFDTHSKWGKQLIAKKFNLSEPNGELIIHYISKHPDLRCGVGVKKATQLWDAYGDKLIEILDSENLDLLEKHLSKITALTLLEKWKQSRYINTVIAWLSKYNFNITLANKILKAYPVDAVNKLEDDPYRLIAFYNWKTVDDAGSTLGIKSNDERRLVASVESALYSRMDKSGHTAIKESELIKLVHKRLNANVIADVSAKEAIDIALTNDVVNTKDGVIQHVGVSTLERFIETKLTELLSQVESATHEQFELLETPDDLLEKVIADYKYPLNKEQKDAVALSLSEPVSVLCGGAGVGKTTVLEVVHDTMEIMGREIYQMALSGRAAQRMREATGRNAHTIAAFLKGLKDKKIKPARQSLIIIDESSMLDLATTYRIVRWLPKGVRIMFVGDPYQLPPISFGSIFKQLTEKESIIPKVELTEIVRQKDSTGIPSISKTIRKGQIPSLKSCKGKSVGVHFIECDTSNTVDMINNLFDIYHQQGGLEDDVQILGILKNSGAAPATSINNEFQYVKSVGKNKFELQGHYFAVDEPVMYTTNNYDKGIFNGSLGVIKNIINEDNMEPSLEVLWDDGKLRNITMSDAKSSLQLSYCVTVHKAQGSQFKRVIIPIYKTQLLDRAMIYTALTRGVEQITFVGSWKVFRDAVLQESRISCREVGFTI